MIKGWGSPIAVYQRMWGGSAVFILETLGHGMAITTQGRLEEKPCKPMRFTTQQEARDWQAKSGIRTPLIVVDVRETDGY